MFTIYNLLGGILSWNGMTLPDYPRLRVFTTDGTAAEILLQAMDLERGAFHFYNEVLSRYKDAPFAPFIDLLARAEEGHARVLYRFYQHENPEAAPFEELYQSLSGEILEGGQSLEEIRNMLENLSETPCLDIVEMAIEIECSAYDLYRSMANHSNDGHLTDAFLAIAQAEKEHMKIAAEALSFCG